MRRKHQRRYQGRFTRLASLARSLTAPAAAGLLLALATLLVIMPAQGNAQEPCPGGGYNPTPMAVAVTAVPIVVESTTDEYFVLYVTFDVDGTEVELPVLVKLGAAGTTTLAENVEALPAERYRVEKYLIADPADVDGDCVDDITELGDPVGMNPVNPAPLDQLQQRGCGCSRYAHIRYACHRRILQVRSARHGHRPTECLLHQRQDALYASNLLG